MPVSVPSRVAVWPSKAPYSVRQNPWCFLLRCLRNAELARVLGYGRFSVQTRILSATDVTPVLRSNSAKGGRTGRGQAGGRSAVGTPTAAGERSVLPPKKGCCAGRAAGRPGRSRSPFSRAVNLTFFHLFPPNCPRWVRSLRRTV